MTDTAWTDLALMTPHAVALIFAFAFGASAGSFINVVAWRMPQGMSVVSPPSRCPTCGFRLKWHHNLPVIGYLRLHGRCAACGVRFGPHYVLVELAMGLIFAGVYAVLFMPPHGSFWWTVGDGWWRAQGLGTALPGLVVVLFAVGSLAAMTLADARTYHIPLVIPVVGSVVAFIGWPVQALLAQQGISQWPLPIPDWPFLLAGIGGMIGTVAAWGLLRIGILKESFADYHLFVAEGETFGNYPHARREMLRELGFLAIPAAGLALGWLASQWLWPTPEGGSASLPLWLQALGACSIGFIAGGAVIWVVRIVTTFMLDIEAMGLGDVHLMACVGAAFGWRAVIVGFVVAPFVGLAWWTVSLVRHAPMRVPFGPSLAVGGVSAFLLWPVLVGSVGWVLSGMGAIAGVSREAPGWSLAIAAVLALLSVLCARRAGRSAVRTGAWSAAAILLLVIAVMGWVFGSPAGATWTGVTGAWLVAVALASTRLANSKSEAEGGPRTVLGRIMLLMVALVPLIGALLIFVRSTDSGQKPDWTPLQPGQRQVQ